MQDTEPLSFTAGDTVQWHKEIANYNPQNRWQLVYNFCSTDNKFEVIAKAEESYYVIRLNSEETSKYIHATYWWQSRVTKEDIQYIIESGELTIKPNLALLDSYDGRSHVKRVLDALEATILGKASKDQLSYSISGRSLSRLSPTELLKWRDVYKAEYARMLSEEQINKGINPNLIKVTFTPL